MPAYTKNGKIAAALGIAILACLMIICHDAPSFAQNANAGEIRGTVTDQTGAAVPGVMVSLTNTETGVHTQVTTDASGVYDAVFLVPGVYTVTFTKTGFKTFVRSGVAVQVGAITVNAHLLVGAVSQSIVVNSAAPLVQTETSKKSLTLDDVTVTETPNVGRSWYNLTVLMPGVNGGGTQNANGEGVGINGAESYQANWLMNGGTATYPVSQNPDWLISNLSAVQEVDLDTHNFSAQYGNGLAVFNVITKSGTNAFHGSVFEYNQNDAFSARNFFAEGVPPLRWNDFGGTFGGPIRHDKAFFFFAYERQPTVTYPITIYTFPTAAMRQGDFSAPGLPTVYIPNSLALVNGQYVRQPYPGNKIPSQDFDPVAAKIQAYFPTPNLPGVVNNYYFSPRSPVTTTWWNGKVDYNITPGNRLEVSFTYSPLTEYDPSPAAPIGADTRNQEEQLAQLTDAWSLSPTMVNEFHFGFLRTGGLWLDQDLNKGYPDKLGLANLTANAFPNITVSGTIPTSLATGLNAILAENSFVPSDTLTWIRGKHILKFGGEFDKWQNNQGWANVDAGSFSFSGVFTRNPSDASSAGLGYGDFLLGLPDTWSDNVPPTTGERLWSTQLFVQDDYKVRPNLTLNIGLRYQIQPGWTEAHNRLSNFDPALNNPATNTLGAIWFAGQGGRKAAQKTVYDAFGPRIGFAWSPKTNWALRGGYGIFDMMEGANTYGGSPGTGWAIQGFQTSTDLLTPIFTMAQGPPLPIVPTAASRTPSLLNGQGVGYIPYNTPVPYLEEWQFDVQHELRGGVMVDVGYVGSRGVHQPLNMDIGQVPPNLIHLVTTGADMQTFRPYPQYGGINALLSEGIANYDALQLSAQKHFSSGFQVIANYTWSKTLDMGTGSGWGGPGANGDVWQNVYDPRSSYGLSLLDMPQTFTGDFIYQLPVGSGRRFLNQGGILSAIVGGWQVSSLWQVHSGIPFTPRIGTANLNGSLAGTWFPNRVGSGSIANPTIQEWFDPSAFSTPDAGTFGNSGRNTLIGPAWKDMDFSLAKHFRLRKLGEGGDLEIRADAFDAFNVPNFGQPNAEIGTPTAGIITSAGTSRTLQLGAKLKF